MINYSFEGHFQVFFKTNGNTKNSQENLKQNYLLLIKGHNQKGNQTQETKKKREKHFIKWNKKLNTKESLLKETLKLY